MNLRFPLPLVVKNFLIMFTNRSQIPVKNGRMPVTVPGLLALLPVFHCLTDFQVLHLSSAIIDGKAAVGLSAGAVDIQRDFAGGVLQRQKVQLDDDTVGGLGVNFADTINLAAAKKRVLNGNAYSIVITPDASPSGRPMRTRYPGLSYSLETR